MPRKKNDPGFRNNGKGAPVASDLQNIRKAMEALKARPQWNEFERRIELDGKPTTADEYVPVYRDAISREWGMTVDSKNLKDVVKVMAWENPHHPVRDWLDTLHEAWDGTPRIRHLAASVFKAEDTELNNEWLPTLLHGMIGRVYKPGVKFDLIQVLYAGQGVNKDIFFNTLAGGSKLVGDAPHMSSYNLKKESKEQGRGIWLMHQSDMPGQRTAQMDLFKSWASATEDHARDAYAEESGMVGRQYAIVASTNKPEMNDFTGLRRLYYLHCVNANNHNRIDIEYVKKWREQLFAEALAEHDFKAEIINLPEHLWDAANEQAVDLQPDRDDFAVIEDFFSDRDAALKEDVWYWLEGSRIPHSQYSIHNFVERFKWQMGKLSTRHGRKPAVWKPHLSAKEAAEVVNGARKFRGLGEQPAVYDPRP